MKKALIIYGILFLLTIAVPAAVCFSGGRQQKGSELVGIFNQQISQVVYYR